MSVCPNCKQEVAVLNRMGNCHACTNNYYHLGLTDPPMHRLPRATSDRCAFEGCEKARMVSGRCSSRYCRTRTDKVRRAKDKAAASMSTDVGRFRSPPPEVR